MNTCNRRAHITVEYKDDTKRPVQQIEYLGKPSEAEIIFPYGVHANLPVNTLLTVWHLDDQPSNKVAMGGMAEKRIQVDSGEVVFYHPLTQSKIYFKNSGEIQIDAEKGAKVIVNTASDIELNCSQLTVNGDTQVNGSVLVTDDIDCVGDIYAEGDIDAEGGVTADAAGPGVTLLGHTHTGNMGIPTSPPTSGT